MKNFAGSMSSVTSPSSLQWVMGGSHIEKGSAPRPCIFFQRLEKAVQTQVTLELLAKF
jgi:hypothetical protein